MKLTNILTIVLVFATSTIILAQEGSNSLGTLITDRPDATESPNLIPKGFLQIETGAFYESFDSNAIKTENYTLNTTLVRLGLLENLELRIGWDFVEGRTAINGVKQDNITSGFNPLLFGAKIGIPKEANGFPEIGLLGHLYLPFTAGSDYKPESTGVDFRFAFAHTLSATSSLSYNLGAQWHDDATQAAYIYTIAYGQSITSHLGFYAELYGDLPEDASANHLWDAGLTYLLSESVQLDATVGSSITEGQDILISAGISFRLPLKKN